MVRPLLSKQVGGFTVRMSLVLCLSVLLSYSIQGESPKKNQKTELKAVLAHELSKGDLTHFQKYLSYIVGPSKSVREYFEEVLAEIAKENPALLPEETLSKIQKAIEASSGQSDISLLNGGESVAPSTYSNED